MNITLENLTKRFPARGRKAQGEVTAVEDLTFEIPDGMLVGLLGPSGCGKSTTLNMICGLETPTSGKIFFGEEDVTALAPELRGVGMVFQNYALYPHLTVMQNILFPLENLKGKERPSRQEMRRRALETAKLVQIEELLERKPRELSGGQRQRVALARSVCSQSPICLMDEPLSNLDAKLRGQMRNEIRRLQKKLGLTVIYVTHDQVEAMTMGDHILVLHGGKIQQMGTPLELYNQPANTFVAGFIGSPQMNLAKAQLTEKGLVLNNDLVVPLTQEERAHLPQGSQWQIGVRAEQIEPASPGEEGTCLVYTQSTEMMGNETQVLFNVGETLFTARWTGQYIIDAGQHLNVTLSADDFHFFDGEKGTLIRPALHIKGFTAQTA